MRSVLHRPARPFRSELKYSVHDGALTRDSFVACPCAAWLVRERACALLVCCVVYSPSACMCIWLFSFSSSVSSLRPVYLSFVVVAHAVLFSGGCVQRSLCFVWPGV